MRSKNYVQRDGTKRMYFSPKQGDTLLYITSRGDDVQNGVRGEGEELIIQGAPDGKNSVSAQFIDDVYIKDGTILWQNAKVGDSVSLEIVLPANTMFISPTRTGNYDIDSYGAVTPNDTGSGKYIMYPIPIILNRFVNKVSVLGDNTIGYIIESADTALVPKQLVMTLTVYSETSNPDLVLTVSAELYRDETV